MSNEVEKFDPSRLMDGVRDRIKTTFVSLIPEGHWEQLCQKEIDKFFHPLEVKTDGKKYESEFTSICNKILTDWANEHLKIVLDTYKTNFWDNVTDAPEPSQLLKDLLVQSAPEIFASVFKGMASKVVYDMRNRSY